MKLNADFSTLPITFANQHFSFAVRRADTDGPIIITRRKRPAYVLMAVADFAALTEKAGLEE